MTIAQTLTDSFKEQLLLGVHDFRETAGDTFKLALYTSVADLGAETTAYTTTGEVVGTGYTAGGAELVLEGVASGDGVAYVRFADLAFPGATFTARGAMIYNTTPSADDGAGDPLVNPSVAVLDFGSDRTVTADTFTIEFPVAAASSAIIRVA